MTAILIRVSGSDEGESWNIDTYVGGKMVSTAHYHSFDEGSTVHSAVKEFGGDTKDIALVVNGVQYNHDCTPGNCEYARAEIQLRVLQSIAGEKPSSKFAPCGELVDWCSHISCDKEMWG